MGSGPMRARGVVGWAIAGMVVLVGARGTRGDELDPATVERGRIALTTTGYISAAWSEEAYRKVGQLWETAAPDPDREPEAYAAAFRRRYGLHPAPYPNDSLPMGLRRGNGPDGTKAGLQIDCLICHGGAIGGASYVGPGHPTPPPKGVLHHPAPPRRPPPP